MPFGARTMSPFLVDAENDSQKSLGPQESFSPLDLWTVQVPRNFKAYSFNCPPTLAYFLPDSPPSFPLKLMLLILGVKS